MGTSNLEYFSAETGAVEKKVKLERLQIVMYSLLLGIMLVLRFNDDMLYDFARSFDMWPDDMRGILTFLIVVCVAMGVLSIAYCIYYSKMVDRLKKSYVSLEKDHVAGIMFPDKESEGIPFKVKYEDITSVVGSNGKDINLRITSKSKEYACLAISNAPYVADKIEEKAEAARARKK